MIKYVVSLVIIFINLLSIFQSIKQTAIGYKIIKARKMPTRLYTQGMFFSEDGKFLFQSSGQYGSSKLVKINYQTLATVKTQKLGNKYFAEGVARCGKFIYLLTWKERTIFKFTYPDMNFSGTLAMDARINEGWGLSSFSATELIASDGSSNLYVLDCNNYLFVKRIIRVKLNNQPLTKLNALAFVGGQIWANVYFSKTIYVINPTTGNVTKTYDMTPLINNEIKQRTLTNALLSSGNVLNGIAYNPSGKFFVLTGKNWGFYYEVNFN